MIDARIHCNCSAQTTFAFKSNALESIEQCFRAIVCLAKENILRERKVLREEIRENCLLDN